MLQGERAGGGGAADPGPEPMVLIKASSRMAPSILLAAIETAEELGHGKTLTVKCWREARERMVLWQQANPGKVGDP